MKKVSGFSGLLFVAVALVFCGCSRPSTKEELLKVIPLDGTETSISKSGVHVDPDSTDGNGSLRLEANEARTFELFEVTDVDVEDTRLIYRARLKGKDISGKAYLEMWVRLPGQGEYFSRGLNQPITGSTNWASREIPFFLKKGQRPDLIRLNLVVDGKGTVWIDDIRLLKGPLR